MESEYLKQYLKKCDLSFTKVVNDKVIKLNNKNDITEPKHQQQIFEQPQPNEQSNVTIPVYQPNNNPFRPTNINNLEQTIIEHYLSYKMPYNVDVESEVNSLNSGLLNETNIKTEPNIYRNIINKYSLNKN